MSVTLDFQTNAYRINDDAEQARVDEFMRTHVGRYVLPKKLDAAKSKGAVSVSVPTPAAVRLLARVGEHVAAVGAEEDAPAFPVALEAEAGAIADLIDWDGEGMAILSREQYTAALAQAARIGYAAPRPVKRRTVKATTPAETVAQAVAGGKANVSLPVGDVSRMLDMIDAERAALAARYTDADRVVEFEHGGRRYTIEVPPSTTVERRVDLQRELIDQVNLYRVAGYQTSGMIGTMFRWTRTQAQEVAA